MNEPISQSFGLSGASWTRQPQGNSASPEGRIGDEEDTV